MKSINYILILLVSAGVFQGIIYDCILFQKKDMHFYEQPVFIGMIIITYWLGIERFSRQKDSMLKSLQQLSTKEQKQLKEIASSIQQIMKGELLFKYLELILYTLSRKLNQKPSLMTKSLNNILQKMFTDYINKFRTKEIKQALRNAKNNTRWYMKYRFCSYLEPK